MVIDKICKMTVIRVKLKSESFFLISHGILEFWRKNLRGGRIPPPGMDRVTAVMKPNLKSRICFDENPMGCEMGKTKVTMNKPVYLGQAILDLTKLVMYEFHYDYMTPKHSKNLKLCYMDTDALFYHIKTEDFYADIAGYVRERFDTSGYDETDSRPLPTGLNKKVIGLMKDESWDER